MKLFTASKVAWLFGIQVAAQTGTSTINCNGSIDCKTLAPSKDIIRLLATDVFLNYPVSMTVGTALHIACIPGTDHVISFCAFMEGDCNGSGEDGGDELTILGVMDALDDIIDHGCTVCGSEAVLAPNGNCRLVVNAVAKNTLCFNPAACKL